MILCLLLDSHSLKTYSFVFEARLYVVAILNVDSVMLMLIGKDITRVIFVFFIGFLVPEIIYIYTVPPEELSKKLCSSCGHFEYKCSYIQYLYERTLLGVLHI